MTIITHLSRAERIQRIGELLSKGIRIDGLPVPRTGRGNGRGFPPPGNAWRGCRLSNASNTNCQSNNKYKQTR